MNGPKTGFLPSSNFGPPAAVFFLNRESMGRIILITSLLVAAVFAQALLLRARPVADAEELVSTDEVGEGEIASAIQR